MPHWTLTDQREEVVLKISRATKGRVAWNKKPPLVCKGCGITYPYKNQRYPSQYCTQQCYLKNNNPSKNPEVLAKISNTLKRDDINPSKRPEVRALISQKLKGRDAFWMKNLSKRLDVRDKLKALALSRWQDAEWVKQMLIKYRDSGMFGYSVESKLHHDMKLNAKSILESKGYQVNIEEPIKIGKKWYIVDVVGINGEKKVAVECGDCKNSKLTALKTQYDNVIHIPYIKESMICRVST